MTKSIVLSRVTLLFSLVASTTQAQQLACARVDSTTEHGQLYSCRDNFHVLVLNGSAPERARAMGQLVREEKLSPDVFNFFAAQIELALKNVPFALGPANALFTSYAKKMETRLSQDSRDAISAFADGVGWKRDKVLRAMVIPDFGNALSGYLKVANQSVARLGCTSFFKRGSRSNVMGRNLDFPGVGYWDAHPLITIIQPTEGSGELKRVAFGADGLFTASISGVNEAGIAMVVHQNSNIDGFEAGMPVTFTGDIVLSRAHSIEEAIEVLRSNHPGAPWTFVISDLVRGRAVAVETAAQYFSVREMNEDGMIAQSNHIENTVGRALETVPYSFRLNSKLRRETAEAMLNSAQTSPQLASSILSFEGAPQFGPNSFVDILKAETIQSVIVEKIRNGALQAYFAVEGAPVASGLYAKFDATRLMNHRFSIPAATLPIEIVDLNPRLSPIERKRQTAWADAYRLKTEDKKFERSLEILSTMESSSGGGARAAIRLKNKDWASAFTDASQGLLALDRETPSIAGPQAGESIARMRQGLFLLGAVASEKGKLGWSRENMQASASQLLQSGVVDSGFKGLLEEISAGRFRKIRNSKLGYDFFSGHIEISPLGI